MGAVLEPLEYYGTIVSRVSRGACNDAPKMLTGTNLSDSQKFFLSSPYSHCLTEKTYVQITVRVVSPIKVMQTSPPPIRSGHLEIKDAQCAENKDKHII